MKNAQIENLIRQLRFKTTAQTRDRILRNVLQTHWAQKIEHPAATTPSVWRIIMKSRITKLAAAAVIIIATCLFFTHQDQTVEVKTQQTGQIAKSPAEMLTIASLNLACRNGGIEAAEEQSRKALKMAGVVKSNMKQLQEELLNSNGL